MQEYINCLGAIIAPLILYCDFTSLSNKSKMISYPLVLSFGNIACELWSQEKGHMLLTIFLVISTLNISSHQRRLQIFHECMSKILEPWNDWISNKLDLMTSNNLSVFIAFFSNEMWLIKILGMCVQRYHNHWSFWK